VPARNDAGNILSGLVSVEGHLTSICNAKVLSSALVAGLGLIDASGPCY
jgi:hypothetical protein